MDQKIEPLDEEWAAHNEKQRAWVRDHYIEASRQKYETEDGKLSLLQTILNEKWIEPSETWKLQSLGITFGDALIHRFPLQWVVVTDDFGICPALRYPGTTLILFAWTTISKRVESGEQIDVRELFEGACDTIQKRLPDSRLHT